MADLAEIAAEVGIAIIDTDGGEEAVDTNNVECLLTARETEQIKGWDAEFSDRYTMSDPDYANIVEAGDVALQQPCVAGFSVFRHRDDRRNWDRDRRSYSDRGGYRNRGNSRGGWNRGDAGDSSSWNRRDRSPYQPQSYGDHHHKGYGSQHTRSDDRNNRNSWGNSSNNNNNQNRAHGHHQNRGSEESYQNRGHSNYQRR